MPAARRELQHQLPLLRVEHLLHRLPEPADHPRALLEAAAVLGVRLPVLGVDGRQPGHELLELDRRRHGAQGVEDLDGDDRVQARQERRGLLLYPAKQPALDQALDVALAVLNSDGLVAPSRHQVDGGLRDRHRHPLPVAGVGVRVLHVGEGEVQRLELLRVGLADVLDQVALQQRVERTNVVVGPRPRLIIREDQPAEGRMEAQADAQVNEAAAELASARLQECRLLCEIRLVKLEREQLKYEQEDLEEEDCEELGVEGLRIEKG